MVWLTIPKADNEATKKGVGAQFAVAVYLPTSVKNAVCLKQAGPSQCVVSRLAVEWCHEDNPPQAYERNPSCPRLYQRGHAV